MPQDTDQVLVDLKKLREGPGLTVERLRQSRALIDALGATTPGDAFERLTLELLRMPDSQRTRALRVDFGLDLEMLLGQAPTPRELDVLSERRNGYAGIVERDIKTVARWSNRAIAELRAQLESEQFDGQIIVAVGVQKRRLVGIEVMRYERKDTNLSHGVNEGYTNPADGPSPPMVLYGFNQRDWQPSAIQFAVTFFDEPPSRAWALAADDISDISFGHERFDLDVEDRKVRCRIENPRRDQVYGVWWEW